MINNLDLTDIWGALYSTSADYVLSKDGKHFIKLTIFWLYGKRINTIY